MGICALQSPCLFWSRLESLFNLPSSPLLSRFGNIFRRMVRHNWTLTFSLQQFSYIPKLHFITFFVNKRSIKIYLLLREQFLEIATKTEKQANAKYQQLLIIRKKHQMSWSDSKDGIRNNRWIFLCDTEFDFFMQKVGFSIVCRFSFKISLFGDNHEDALLCFILF